MIRLLVKPSDPITFVKQLIEYKEGIPFDQQQLKFVSEILEDGHTLSDYNIVAESTLHLILGPSTAMLIFIKMPFGNVMTVLKVEPKTSIRHVKDKIEHSRIPPDDKRLLFAGHELEDDRTLEDYHIKDKGILELRGPKVMKLFVHVSMPTKKLITLEVEPETSIRNVKEKIQQKSGFLIDQQHLFSGNQELANERSLTDYNVPEKISLHLTEDLKRQYGMRVYLITPTGKTTSLVVLSSESVESVKNEIYDKEGIPPDEQRLTLDGKELTYGSLMDYNIKNDSVLRLVRRPPPANHCFIKMPTGKMIRLEVKLETSIKEVKLNVQDKEGIPVDQQHLLFRGEELADERTLKDCSIPKDATLHLKLGE